MRLAVFVLVLTAAACSNKPAPPPAKVVDAAAQNSNIVSLEPDALKSAGVRVDAVTERPIGEVVRASARLTNNENRTWRVGAITEGRVIRMLAAPGDFVKEDQALARLHSHDVHDSRAEHRKARNELARANASADYARKARDRAKRLFDLKAGSLEQVERVEAELRNAEAALATATSEVERTRAHLEEFLGVPSEGGVDFKSDHDADDRDLIPVRSPATGTVLSRNVTSGTVVTPANDLFIICDLASLWAIAEVSEEHLAKIRVGMPVRIFVQAWPNQPFTGRISKIGEALDSATHTVKVRVELANRDGRLKPEMYATAEIEVGGTAAGVFAPEASTQEVRGQTVVFVETGAGKFEARPVETGRTLDGAVQIRRGLKPGERIATAGTFILKSEFLKSALAGE